MANKFELDRYCDVCQRNSIWYDGHCTRHSNWKQGAKHPVPDVMILMKLKDTPKEPTEAEFRRMNRLERKLLTVSDNSQAQVLMPDWAYGYFGVDPKDLRDDQRVKDPSKTYCTFCGNEVDEINRLTEKTKPRVRFTNEPVMDPKTREIHTQRKVQVYSETLNACPNCVLQIRKPITVQRV